MKTSFIFSIHEIYHLREVLRVSKRTSVGRLFYTSNKFGIFDLSGILWPIHIKSKNKKTFKHGDVIKFHSSWKDKSIHITQILEYTSNQSAWKNHHIMDPLNFEINDITTQTTSISIPTQYFEHKKLNERFTTLSHKNEALIRTKSFFENRNFFHIETPILVPSGGMENYLHTFQTQYRDFQGRDWTYELPTSPEFSLKKVLSEGIPKVFQIARAFRNHGEHSNLHEPEFLMLEWYRAGGLLQDILNDTQQLVHALAAHLNSKRNIPKVWPTFTVKELFLKLLDINLDNLQNTKDFYSATSNLSPSVRKSDTWDDIFCKLFMEKIEPFLKEQIACFVTSYPVQMSALAENDRKSPFYVQRAEAYLFGVEISNGYQELVDSVELSKRIDKTQTITNGGIKEDAQFKNIMEFGLPPCAGNALGFDRVFCLLLNITQIQEVFPLPFASYQAH